MNRPVSTTPDFYFSVTAAAANSARPVCLLNCLLSTNALLTCIAAYQRTPEISLNSVAAAVALGNYFHCHEVPCWSCLLMVKLMLLAE
jgi:hypothetical protein